MALCLGATAARTFSPPAVVLKEIPCCRITNSIACRHAPSWWPSCCSAPPACGKSEAAGRRSSWRRPAARRRHDCHARTQAGRGKLRFHRDAAITAVDHGPAGRRRHRDADLRQGRRPRARRRAARADQRRASTGGGAERGSQPHRHRMRTSSTGVSRSSGSSRCSRPARSAARNSIRRRTRCAPPRRNSARSTRRCARARYSSVITASRRCRREPSATFRSASATASRPRRSSRRSTTTPASSSTSRCRSTGRPTCGSACRCNCSTARARSCRPARSPSSRRGWTMRRRPCSPRVRSSSSRPAVRLQQFVRSRIVWRTADGLTVPVTAVTRISGQYFCFVAEPGPQGGVVAKQRPLQVGEVIGNDYVVTGGVKAGRPADRVRHPEARRRRARAARLQSQSLSHVCRHFHPTSDPRVGLLAGHHPGRRGRHSDACRWRSTRISRRRR